MNAGFRTGGLGDRYVTANAHDISRTVMRNSVVVSVGNWVAKLLYLAFNVVVVRWLGEVGLGRYATVIAFVGLFGILFNFGMSQHMERAIARDPRLAAGLFWNLVALRGLLAVLGVGAITWLAILSGYDRSLVTGVFLYALTYILAAGQIPLTSVLKAHDRFDLVTATLLLGRVLSMGVGIVLLWFGAGFFALLVTGFVAIPVQIGCSVWAIRANNIDLANRRITPRAWTSMIRTGLPFGLLALGLSFNANVVTVILGLFSDDGTVGWYNAAYRLVFHGVGILGGFLVVMMPSLTRAFQRDPAQVARWTTTTFDWMILIVLPASAGLSLLAPRVIRLLYSSAYAPAGPVFRMLAWDIPLMLGVAFFANVCAAIGLERSAARIYIVGMLMNVAVAIVVIPVFTMTGAAAVNLVIDFSSAVAFAVVLRRRVDVRYDLTRLGRILAATILMSAIVWLCRSLPLVVVVAIGATAYVALTLAFGLIAWEMLVTTVRRRFGISIKPPP